MKNNRKECITKLLDKGFSWYELDIFFLIHGLNIMFIPIPPDIRYIWGYPIEEQKIRWDEHFKKQWDMENERWEVANIAADFEQPR